MTRVSGWFKILLCSFFAVGFLGCQKVANKQTSSVTHKDPTAPFAGDGGQSAPLPPVKVQPTPDAPPAPVLSEYCRPDSQGRYPFRFQIVGGTGNDPEFGGYDYGQGGGCIARNIREVWATSMNQDLMIWNDTRGDGSTLLDPPRGILRLFDVHYHVTAYFLGFPITVTWKMHWYHSVSDGTPTNPLRVLINYNRYEGTSHIAYWQGSIVLSRVSDTVTGVWFRNQIHADRTGVDGAESAISDMFTKLKTGAPDWHYLP